MAVEERVGSPVPSFFWVIGGLVVIALVVAICVVWRSRKRRKKDQKATKRSVKTDDNLEQNGSGDEMQPLVAPFGTPTNASSTPSFAGICPSMHTYVQLKGLVHFCLSLLKSYCIACTVADAQVRSAAWVQDQVKARQRCLDAGCLLYCTYCIYIYVYTYYIIYIYIHIIQYIYILFKMSC